MRGKTIRGAQQGKWPGDMVIWKVQNLSKIGYLTYFLVGIFGLLAYLFICYFILMN
jgi:hypothetical protein